MSMIPIANSNDTDHCFPAARPLLSNLALQHLILLSAADQLSIGLMRWFNLMYLRTVSTHRIYAPYLRTVSSHSCILRLAVEYLLPPVCIVTATVTVTVTV